MSRRDDLTIFIEKFKPDMGLHGEIKRYWERREEEDLEKLQSTDNQYIWTVIEGDNQKWYIVPGWHIVNREWYIITSIPWKEGQRDYLYG